LGRPQRDGFGNRSTPDTIEAGSLVRTQDDQVRASGARMQQDHARRIAVLDADLEANARLFRRLAQCRGHGDALSRMPSEWPVLRHRVHDGEFGVMHAAEGERVIERGPRRLRSVDGRQNTSK
jgi:hypothetical protein